MEPSSSSTTIAVSLCSPLTLKLLPLFMCKKEENIPCCYVFEFKFEDTIGGFWCWPVNLYSHLTLMWKLGEFTKEASQVESHRAIHIVEFTPHAHYQLFIFDSSRNRHLQSSALFLPKKIHFNLAGSFKENLYSREKSMLNQLKLKCVNSNSIQHEVDARLEVTINS